MNFCLGVLGEMRILWGEARGSRKRRDLDCRGVRGGRSRALRVAVPRLFRTPRRPYRSCLSFTSSIFALLGSDRIHSH